MNSVKFSGLPEPTTILACGICKCLQTVTRKTSDSATCVDCGEALVNPRTVPEIEVFIEAEGRTSDYILLTWDAKGNWDYVFQLINENGFDPNRLFSPKNNTDKQSPHYQPRSLMMVAAAQSNAEVCKKLIELGADPTISGPSPSQGPPIVAVVRGRHGTGASGGVLAVLDALANTVNTQDSQGKTALMWASRGVGSTGAWRGSKRIVKKLFRLRADPNILDANGHTALWHAVYANKHSKVSSNDGVVAILRTEMVEFEARRIFYEEWDYEIDDNKLISRRKPR